MKSLKLAVVVSSVALMASGLAQADQYKHNMNNQNFMAKRPYQQVLPESAYQTADQWEGATLISERAQVQSGASLSTHMLGKRPFM